MMKPEDLIGKRVAEVMTDGLTYGSQTGAYLTFSITFDDGTKAYARLAGKQRSQVTLAILSAEELAQAKARK